MAELVTKGTTLFAIGDVLRLKDGISDEWMQVTAITDISHYTVTRDLAGSYPAGENPAWTKGAAVVNYGQSGDGGVYLTASDSNAPYLSVFSHSGSPWMDLISRLRLGNLNGFLGYVTDLYGIGIGNDAAHFKYDPTNGVRVRGNIDGSTITGGTIIGSLIKTAISGRRIQIDSDGIKFLTGTTSGKYSSFKYGDGTLYGSGLLAYFYNTENGYPFFVQSEQIIADIHHYNRGNTPSGAALIGDTCVVNGKHMICTVAGTPGTWVVTGSQTA